MPVILGFLLGLAAVVAAALFYIYSGLFNVAATAPHSPIARWAFDTAMHQSVARRAEGIEPPAEFTDAQVRDGAAHFRATCVMCHGGPGVEPTEVGNGLRPTPPDLAEVSAHLSVAQQYWVVKNGIKMTAMPAFGPTHGDQELWAIVGFIQKLPTMSAEEFRRLSGGEKGS